MRKDFDTSTILVAFIFGNRARILTNVTVQHLIGNTSCAQYFIVQAFLAAARTHFGNVFHSQHPAILLLMQVFVLSAKNPVPHVAKH